MNTHMIFVSVIFFELNSTHSVLQLSVTADVICSGSGGV